MASSSKESPFDQDIEANIGLTTQYGIGNASAEETPLPSASDSSAAARKEKGRVRFNSNAALTQPPPVSPAVPGPASEPRSLQVSKPRPSVLRGSSANSIPTMNDFNDSEDIESRKAAAFAQERAKQVAERVRRDSPTPASRHSSDSNNSETAASEGDHLHKDESMNIPLRNMGHSGNGDVDDIDRQDQLKQQDDKQNGLQEEAYNIVRSHTQRFGKSETPLYAEAVQHDEYKTLNEINDGNLDGVYAVPAPAEYRGSVLSQLLKLYKPAEYGQQHQRNTSSSSFGRTGENSAGSHSGSTTPTRKKWYEQNRSQDTLANLVEASTRLANPNLPADERKGRGKSPSRTPIHKRAGSSSRLSGLWQKEEAKITVHIAETLSRQEYIIQLCRALMLFGAPTHRLEEYLSMTARVLEIDGQFLYLPGCMIISFDDRSTHTTEVRIVRSAQGIDLGRLKDVHRIYKEVMHDVIGVEEGIDRLDVLMKAKNKFHPWFRAFIFGLTSAAAAPFSFQARLIDLPMCFVLGSLVGILQLIVAPMSNLYSNILEVTATVLVSFLARAFGSLRGGDLFCFSALAQGGIVMLLPGFLVLSSALELQARAIVPGSIRMVYAVIYCLLLGYGITVGASLYGSIDSHATSETQCRDPIPSLYGFIFVPLFVVCISILYQAKWRQMPVMVVVAFAGYIVNYFSSKHFTASPQIANTLGALTVGVLANLYSRIRHGVAAAVLIPAIFTQVPGGLASTGGLLSGLRTANLLTNSTHVVNGTESMPLEENEPLNTVVFDVAASMIQIATGIAVGLFISALIIYPLGKRRSGLFSF